MECRGWTVERRLMTPQCGFSLCQFHAFVCQVELACNTRRRSPPALITLRYSANSTFGCVLSASIVLYRISFLRRSRELVFRDRFRHVLRQFPAPYGYKFCYFRNLRSYATQPQVGTSQICFRPMCTRAKSSQTRLVQDVSNRVWSE